ncbi:unnamed protein product [Cylicocyclus nassatus]|uniref:Uncharacterized protein n=1 Tax=Cylicocyclus nassatus TaxID=53992 RepID=A0AA36GK55_CYLNA|nr:unnamed protein product [Cylicocyclus nassatus]
MLRKIVKKVAEDFDDKIDNLNESDAPIVTPRLRTRLASQDIAASWALRAYAISTPTGGLSTKLATNFVATGRKSAFVYSDAALLLLYFNDGSFALVNGRMLRDSCIGITMSGLYSSAVDLFADENLSSSLLHCFDSVYAAFSYMLLCRRSNHATLLLRSLVIRYPLQSSIELEDPVYSPEGAMEEELHSPIDKAMEETTAPLLEYTETLQISYSPDVEHFEDVKECRCDEICKETIESLKHSSWRGDIRRRKN